jgi:hypothetical protein
MTLDEKVYQMVHSARGISHRASTLITGGMNAFMVLAGGQQPDKRSEELTGKTVLSKDFSIPDLIDEQLE